MRQIESLSNMLNGILLGFGAAVFQSTSYIGSRVFSHKYPDKTLHLLSLSHIIMGVFALLMLPFVWPDTMSPCSEYVISLTACSGFYLIGQTMLFVSLKKSSASRVSPLLGIKVFILAFIGIAFLGQKFGILQWTAIAMSVVAAWMLSRTGEKLSFGGAILIFLTCLAYCLSDINIKILVNHFDYLGRTNAILLAVCLSYIVCGIAAIVLLFFLPRPTKKMFAYSLPFATAWFAAMLFLFACFSGIGVVYGNIVQSSRGVLSIIMGAALVRYNFEYLDQKVPRIIFFQRLAAAALMSGAIALYYLGA
jgi:drug/metabolite transporter (DMT)-like permease